MNDQELRKKSIYFFEIKIIKRKPEPIKKVRTSRKSAIAQYGTY